MQKKNGITGTILFIIIGVTFFSCQRKEVIIMPQKQVGVNIKKVTDLNYQKPYNIKSYTFSWNDMDDYCQLIVKKDGIQELKWKNLPKLTTKSATWLLEQSIGSKPNLLTDKTAGIYILEIDSLEKKVWLLPVKIEVGIE